MHQHAAPEMLNDPIGRISFPGHVLVSGACSDGSLIVFYAKCAIRRSPSYRLYGGPNFISKEVEKERESQRLILHGCRGTQRVSVCGNGDHAFPLFRVLERNANQDEFDRMVDKMYWKPGTGGARTSAAFVHKGERIRLWMAHVFRDPETGTVKQPRISCDTVEPGKGLFLPTAQGMGRGRKVRPYTGLPMEVTLKGQPPELFASLRNKLPPRYYVAAGMCAYNPHTRVPQFFTDNHFKLPLRR